MYSCAVCVLYCSKEAKREIILMSNIFRRNSVIFMARGHQDHLFGNFAKKSLVPHKTRWKKNLDTFQSELLLAWSWSDATIFFPRQLFSKRTTFSYLLCTHQLAFLRCLYFNTLNVHLCKKRCDEFGVGLLSYGIFASPCCCSTKRIKEFHSAAPV